VAEGAVEPDWVTKAEAARRLGISEAGFTRWAKEAGTAVQRRGNRPSVNWRSVEAWIARSRIDPGVLGDHPQRTKYERPQTGEQGSTRPLP
jgi:hypothetical protein